MGKNHGEFSDVTGKFDTRKFDVGKLFRIANNRVNHVPDLLGTDSACFLYTTSFVLVPPVVCIILPARPTLHAFVVDARMELSHAGLIIGDLLGRPCGEKRGDIFWIRWGKSEIDATDGDSRCGEILWNR